METRRLFFALFAALTVYMTYMVVYSYIRPQPAPPATTSTQPVVANPDGDPAPGQAVASTDGGDTPASTQPGDTSRLDSGYGFASDPAAEPVTLGGRDQDDLRMTLSPRGAAVGTIDLVRRAAGSDKYVHRETAAGNDPYTLIQPVQGGGTFESYVTSRVWITYLGNTTVWDLSGLNWNVAEARPDQVVFQTFLAPRDIAQRWWGGPAAGEKPSAEELREGMLVRLRKTYTLIEGKPLVMLRLEAENRTGAEISVAFEQFGPVGVPGEHIQYNMRYLVAAIDEDGQLSPEARDGARLRKPTSKGDRVHTLLTTAQDRSLAWVALTNKYFAVVTRPLPRDDGASTIRKLTADVADYDSPSDKRGDMRARLETLSVPIGPGAARQVDFEIYAGSKATEDLREASPAFADRSKLAYALLRDVDQRCCCTFASLTGAMTGLLDGIQSLVGNYGIAIIILVIIIRTVLHPLTVFQQKSMFRTQEGMGRIQPKLNELKKKYGDDRVKFNQEMMKLYSEENVNPAAPLVSMLPMMIQMPILIALWTGINTDINLRHAIFDGWWIKDLSAPDAFYSFSQPVSIPVLSWLPLIGFAFKDIPSINILPVLMGVSMWLQQKYMPKPHLDEKIKAAQKAREEGREPETGMGGMTVEDQVRQQHMIAMMMSVLFPLMFYYMPSGLNLYWMATNVFGIFESLRVRKQLDAEKARKALEGDQPVKKGGFMSAFFKKMAEQAEDVQRQFDELSQQEHRKSGNKEAQERKKKSKK